MEMVLVVLGVLAVMIAIDRQLHERDMRLKALKIRSEREVRRIEAGRDA